MIVRADALRSPLRTGSVDLIITSPPYFALRSYQDEQGAYHGQVGAEPEPAAYLDAMWVATAEMARVVTDDASIWVNLGDKYAGSGGHNNRGLCRPVVGGLRRNAPTRYNQATGGVPPKSLMGLPWRYALGCIDQLGLTLRAEVIWAKPNGMPQTVRDRVQIFHEHWFHFTKGPQYYSAVDELRPLAQGSLPGSVWVVAPEPFDVPDIVRERYDLPAHFAAFPTEIPRRIVLGWSPPGICTECGQGRRPVVQKSPAYLAWRAQVGDWNRHKRAAGGGYDLTMGNGTGAVSGSVPPQDARIVGYACRCAPRMPPTRPAVVLDPFGGTGTVAMVAESLGRRGISGDHSHAYCRLARWRTQRSGQGARAESRTWAEHQLALSL
jgi:DNA modification methylase